MMSSAFVMVHPVAMLTNLTCSDGVTDLRHLVKTAVIPDAAFLT